MADRIAIFRSGPDRAQGTPDAVLATRAMRSWRLHRPRSCAEAAAPASLREILEPCNRAFARGAPSVTPEDDLRTALSMLVEADLDALPCYQPDGNMRGMVRLARIRGCSTAAQNSRPLRERQSPAHMGILGIVAALCAWAILSGGAAACSSTVARSCI
jgi:hypothetical protein